VVSSVAVKFITLNKTQRVVDILEHLDHVFPSLDRSAFVFAVCACDSNSKVAKHANVFNHNMDFDQATIVKRVTDYHKRVFLEAWHSLRDQNAGNEHIDIPDINKSLAMSHVFCETVSSTRIM